MILILKRSLKQTADNNNLETKLNFSKNNAQSKESENYYS